MREIFVAIAAERARQDAEHDNHGRTAPEWLVVLAEEFGEVARAIYEGDAAGLRTELVQVGAVAVQWLEAMEREGLACQES